MKYFSKKRLLSLFILLISAGIIFWQFPTLPRRLAFDEIEFTRLALNLWGHWQLFSPEATGHATPYFYLVGLSLKTFGINALGLRLPAAIFGTLNPVLLFLILRFFFKDKIAFWGSLVFASMHWVFQFSRFAFEATYLLFLEFAAVYNLLRYLKHKRPLNFSLLIVFSVMAFYSYLPGRVFFLLPLSILHLNKTPFKKILLFLGIFSALVIPLLFSAGTFESRVSSLTYLNQPLEISEKVSYFATNLSKNLLMLNFEGDLNGRHNYPGKPGLNLFIGILFWIGLAISLKEPGKYTLFYLWSVLSLAGTLFTFPAENPHFLRTYTLTASLVFFITLAFSRIWPKKHLLEIMLIVLIILSGIYEIRTYFKYQRMVFKHAFESTVEDLKQIRVR